MGILIFIVGLAFVILLLLFFAVKIFEVVGFFALSILAVASIAIGYISIFIGGISLAALYQLWGEQNMGWAIAASGIIGLLTALALLKAIVNEIKSFSARFKKWFGKDNKFVA